MDESPRFKLVFTKLREALQEDEQPNRPPAEIRIHSPAPLTSEELDEIEEVRRVVLEVTEVEPMSYTTT